jgi:hypothetical protein
LVAPEQRDHLRLIQPHRVLAEALEASMVDVMNGVELDQDYVRTITGPFTWEGIFARIEAVYRRAAGGR